MAEVIFLGFVVVFFGAAVYCYTNDCDFGDLIQAAKDKICNLIGL